MAVSTAAPASGTKRVYIPTPMNIQFPASQEYPEGRVVQLNQGYMDLDEDLQNHPMLSRLAEDTLPGEAERQDRLYEAQKTRDEAVNEAELELAKEKGEIEQERQEELASFTEEYDKRRAEAFAAGQSFNEQHPDLDTRRAIALTAPPGMIAAAQYNQRALVQPTEPAPLPTEAELKEQQQQFTRGSEPPPA